MARQSNYDKLKNYRQRIDSSRMWRKNDGYDDLWQRMINLYRGRQYRGVATGDRLLVNICFSTINTLLPSVSIGRPKILVNPRRPEDGDKAVVTESIINYWWQHYECQPEFQRAVKDYLILGHGWVKTGYRFIEEEKIDEIEYSADEAAESEEVTDSVESDLIIREDRPFLERVDPFDMFIDMDAIDMTEARWIAQRVRRPLKAAREDKRYNATVRKDLAPSQYRKYSTTNYTASYVPEETDEAYVDIFEYYDIEAGTMCVFSDSGDGFLIKPTKMPYAFGHPYFQLRNYSIPNFFYPMGELEAIEPLQYELNETRTQMMNHRKRYSRKWLALESAFDDFGRQMLSSDDDNVIVPVKGSENLNNVVVPMPALINPPEFYNQSALILNDIDRVSGISEYQRGAIPETTRTAREASIIAEAGNARVADKLVSIENSIARCAQNMIMLAQQFMTGTQVVRIVGTENRPMWLKFDRDYITGEFDFNVEAGSTAPRNEAFRRDMALQVVSAVAPFAQAGLINMPRLLEYVLGTGFGIKNPADFIQQAPAPQGMAQGMAPGMEQGMPQDLPPEMLAGMVPSAPIQGPGAQVGAEDPAAILQSLPPEILAALLGQAGQAG